MEENRKRLLGAGLFWGLGQGMEKPQYLENCSKSLVGLTLEKDKKTIGFLTEYDAESEDQLNAKIISASGSFGEIYVVFSNFEKADEYKAKVPNNCGIICSHNPYGLGAIVQKIKLPKLVDF